MKTIYSKLLATVLSVAAGASIANAETRLYPEDLTVTSYDPVELNIMLDIDEGTTVSGLNFDIQLPMELEFVVPEGSTLDKYAPTWNKLRFGAGAQEGFAAQDLQNGKAFVMPTRKTNFKGESGIIATFMVKAAKGALDNAPYELTNEDGIVLTGIALSSGFGDDAIEVGNSEANASVKFIPGTFSMSATNSEIDAYPGKNFKVTLDLNTTEPLTAVQFTVNMPEGFEVVYDEESEENPIYLSDRCSSDASVSVGQSDNSAVFGVIDFTNSNLMSAGEGEFITFEIKAASEFESEATIDISNITLVLEANNASVDLDPISFKVVNAEPARQEANAAAYKVVTDQIAEMTKALEDAKAEIEETYPTFLDEEAYDAVAAQIEALTTEAKDAYEAVAEEGVFEYAISEEKATEIADATKALIDNAKAAFELSQANYTAYQEAEAAINGLLAKYADAVETIETDYAAGYDEETATAILDEIKALQHAVEAAMDEVNENGGEFTVEGLDETVAEIGAKIEAMVDAAKVAANDARIKANLQAHFNDQRIIYALSDEFENAMTALDEEFPKWSENELYAEYEAQRVALDAKINNLFNLIDAALAAVEEEGVYESPLTEELQNEISEEIETLVTNLTEVATEDVRVLENMKAQQNDLYRIRLLSDKFQEGVATLDEKYPDWSEAFPELEAQRVALDLEISNLESLTYQALADVAEEGVYESPITDVMEQMLTSDIEEFLAAVEEAGAAKALEEANNVAYGNDSEALTELLGKYNEAVEEIETEYASAFDEETAGDILAEINALMMEVDAAYNNAIENGTEYSVEDLDKKIAAIEAEIDAMVETAKEVWTGVAGIEADSDALYFDMNGHRIANPAAGQMVIIVRDGKATKHIVK